MNTKTPEERAAERFPIPEKASDLVIVIERSHQAAYATCIREEVEPLEAEVAKLRALVQVLVDGLGTCGAHVNEESILVPHFSLFQVKDALDTAKEHGFVPTNTTEG